MVSFERRQGKYSSLSEKEWQLRLLFHKGGIDESGLVALDLETSGLEVMVRVVYGYEVAKPNARAQIKGYPGLARAGTVS